jgi:uncharacterized membrane protein YphA (DoxX/SURF4 family)
MKALTRSAEIVLRLALGGLFLYAGASKFASPAAFADAIHAYRILPAALINPVALALPVFELMLGACLLVGWCLREMSLAAAFIGTVFLVAIVQARLRGLDLDCGCFGPNTWAVIKAVPPLARDAVLLAGALFLRWRSCADGPA